LSATEPRLAPAEPEAPVTAPGSGISPGLVLVFAIACGATVANLYYAQPLLSPIARAFGVSDGTAGLLVTVSQVCYAIGLFLLVPLGDLVDRRRLLVRLLALCAVAMAVAAVSPDLVILAAGLGVASFATVVVQILVPLAGTLAPAQERGRIVGTVMSGVLSGILLARTVSGLIAGIAGWRAPFYVAAAMMVVLAVVMWRALPRVASSAEMPYPRLLASVGRLVRAEPRLRRRMVYGSCGFAGFSVVWTTVAFLLAGGRYHYGSVTIGLFGLAGLLGAVGASGVGRIADRGHGRSFTGVVLAMVLASWGILAFAPHSLIAVIAGLIVLDFAVQGQNIVSQHVIYGIGTGQASRINTAYMVSNFIGGAIGSAAGSIAWDHGGWGPVCVVGAVIAAIPLAFWLTEPGLLGRRARTRAADRA
jgi:predicted MFS family arabinose efflux permease